MVAICFKCGSEKSGALVACQNCSAAPRTNSESAVSLALSDHLSSNDQLTQYCFELHSDTKLSVPREVLVEALNALKDPQLLAMLGARPPAPASLAPGAQPQPPPVSPEAPQQTASAPMPGDEAAQLITTVLHQSPFAVLSATIRDNRRRIVELAEEKSLELDHDACQKARSDLTNTRTRLSVEIAWLPGVSPRKASLLLDALRHDPMAIRVESGLPTLAHLNLLAAALEAVDGRHDSDDLSEFIQEIAYLAEELVPEDVLRDINEDRAVSGFPQVRALGQIEAEFTERKRCYLAAIRKALDRLPSTTLVQVMTDTVHGVTEGGEEHAPELIDGLVDWYEVEAQGLLQKEADNIHKLITATRDSMKLGETAVISDVDKLDTVARNWDSVAQPIQLSAKARGIDHEPSRVLAGEIRSLAIDLFNEHDMLAQSQRLMGLLQDIFLEVPDVSERIEQDVDTLTDIFNERNDTAVRREEWAREITYQVEIGVLFKNTLRISPAGVSWKGKNYPLDSITRIRWGGVRHSVNGIPTGTIYTVAFGDSRSEMVVELKKEKIYSTFIDKAWRAVCLRLLGEMLEELKIGRDLYFDDALLHDDGITMVKHKLLGANQRVRCTWAQVHVWNADGFFCIGAQADKRTYARISYIHSANTHILEQAIRMKFKAPGTSRLSELLQ